MAESQCLYNYVVTAQRPTAVTHTAVGCLVAPDSIDLLVGKCTQLELFTLKKKGLQPIKECPVNGRIATLEIFRQPDCMTDSVLLLTERMMICIINFDQDLGEWVTQATGSVYQRIGNEARHGLKAFVDPTNRFVGLHLYDGQLKILSIFNGRFSNVVDIKLDELCVFDICFLSSTHLNVSKPIIAILSEDTRRERHLKTYIVNSEEKTVDENQWFLQNSNVNLSKMIIPLYEQGGLLLIGESLLYYFSPKHPDPVTKPVPETNFTCYAKIDGCRYVLGDHMGQLYSLAVHSGPNSYDQISFYRLGEVAIPESISYLDSGVLFVGSKCGDSQLIKLADTQRDDVIVELSRFINLGPILDFCVVDLERQGQCQIVTCSGAFMEGSLRVIRNGIGIMDQATETVTGIQGLWSLKKWTDDLFDTYLVMSFTHETRVLAFNDPSSITLDVVEIPSKTSVAYGFERHTLSIHCANMSDDALLQITPNGVYTFLSAESIQSADRWIPEDKSKITVAASSPSQIVVACGSSRLYYFEVAKGRILETCRFQVEDEVSCIDITPIGDDKSKAKFAATGTWDMRLHLIDLQLKKIIRTFQVSNEVIPRSVLFAMFEGNHYLLVGMGDGRLIANEIDPSTGLPSDEKRISIGTKPVTLSRFYSKGSCHIFAASDRPTVIYGEQKKLMFSNLNEQNVNFFVSFNTCNAPDCLAMAKDDGLTIGTIDEIQKLHIKTRHLKQMPRRIVHQPETKTYGVVTESYLPDGRPQSYFKVFDDETFEVKASFPFECTETGSSLMSICLPNKPDGSDRIACFLIGTAFVVATEYEPTKGRLLVCNYDAVMGHPNITLLEQKEFKGAIFAIKPIKDRLLITVNSKVHILEWKVADNGAKSIAVKDTQQGHILAMFADVRDNIVLIGDLMRSISLLVYDSETEQLDEKAKDSSSNWMMAVKALDDDIYLGAEHCYNLFTLKRTDRSVGDDDGKLETVGAYHMGDQVNVLREGSLVASSNLEGYMRSPVIFGTISGEIGLILSLTKERYEFLEVLQSAMREVVRSVGGFDHEEFRKFYNERQTRATENFVDGNLIEAFLDLKTADMELVSKEIDKPVEYIYRIVENLSKLH